MNDREEMGMKNLDSSIEVQQEKHHYWLEKYGDGAQPESKRILEDRLGVGMFQYILISSKGKISLVKTKNMNNVWFWEIYSKNKLFFDVEKFETKNEAIDRINHYLAE